MVYIFNSLKENKILKEKDHIAIITPIFSPYLEIPELNDYKLVEIHIKGDEKKGWQLPDSEIQKLEDPKIKALFFVNPTNPTSVALNKESLEIGRSRVFTPGWLENESIWLHMEYKYLIELIKGGLVKEYYDEIKTVLSHRPTRTHTDKIKFALRQKNSMQA